MREAEETLETSEREAAEREAAMDAAAAAAAREAEEKFAAAMRDAAELRTPKQLRTFFAHLLLQCELADPASFWDQFRESLTEDFTCQSRHPRQEADDLALSGAESLPDERGRN